MPHSSCPRRIVSAGPGRSGSPAPAGPARGPGPDRSSNPWRSALSPAYTNYRVETTPNGPGVADSCLPTRSGHGAPQVGVPLSRARGASSTGSSPSTLRFLARCDNPGIRTAFKAITRVTGNTWKARAGCVPTMRVTTVRPSDLGPGEAEIWATLQRSSPLMLSPYLSLTFAQIVGSARPNARIAVVEDHGKIVAFLAYELTSMKLAEPIGYPMNDLQGIISADTEIDARSVIRKAGLRGWRFYYTPAQHRPLVPHHYSGTTVQCAIIDLSGGYQPWISERGRSGTKRIAEKRRSLQRHIGPVSLLWNSSRPEHLRQLLEWKTGKHSWMRGMFADDPSAIRIVEGMAAARSADCSGVVSVLLAGDQMVAVHLGLQGPRGLSSWLPSYDSELSRFSPGMMMWYPIAEEAVNRGIMLIDFGYGQHDYKFRLANGSYPVAGGAVWASQIEEHARGAYRRVYGRVRSKGSSEARVN